MNIVVYEWECPACKEKIRDVDADALEAKKEQHIANECAILNFLRLFPKDMKLGDIYYILKGRYPKGYKPKHSPKNIK